MCIRETYGKVVGQHSWYINNWKGIGWTHSTEDLHDAYSTRPCVNESVVLSLQRTFSVLHLLSFASSTVRTASRVVSNCLLFEM